MGPAVEVDPQGGSKMRFSKCLYCRANHKNDKFHKSNKVKKKEVVLIITFILIS